MVYLDVKNPSIFLFSYLKIISDFRNLVMVHASRVFYKINNILTKPIKTRRKKNKVGGGGGQREVADALPELCERLLSVKGI